MREIRDSLSNKIMLRVPQLLSFYSVYLAIVTLLDKTFLETFSFRIYFQKLYFVMCIFNSIIDKGNAVFNIKYSSYAESQRKIK